MSDYIFSHDPVLDAVNEIISSVGSPPINSLTQLTNADAIDALRMLMRTSRQVQAQGWVFNLQFGEVFTPDAITGKIVYTTDIISMISSNRIINKGGFFYDLDLNTDIFTSPITISEIIREFKFEDLPDVARDYITAKTSRDFQRIKVTSVEMDQSLAIREAETLMRLNALEIDMGGYNLYENNSTVSSNQSR
jgi:hypothetical protein